MINQIDKVNFTDATLLIKKLCNDFGLDVIDVEAVQTNEYSGSYYGYTKIASIELNTTDGLCDFYAVLHEFSHHLHLRRNPELRNPHTLEFFRICYEVRDHVEFCYGVVPSRDICGYKTKSADKANYEWRVRRGFV